MAGNVVEILVKADNATQAGFGEAKAGADEAAAAMDEYAAASDRAAEAQARLAEAQARLDELQASGKASAEELDAAQAEYAAALDRSTSATLASIDAQVRLGEAEMSAAGAAKAGGDAAEAAGVKAETSGGLMAGMGSKVKMAALGVAVGMGMAVKGAADFQQQTTRLVTSAGESAAQLGLVQRGILSLSSTTNTSTEQLAKGMYLVESAGFHGAAGLTVLKAAAQGAQAEGADLGEVANAVTSGLNAYGMKASQAAAFTDQMVAAVGQGKMTMQDLAASLSAVLPIAASAHISFAQVGGAVATMTSQGMSAQQATQDLAHAIRGLLSPNAVAVNEMNQLGVSSTDVAQHLGSRGLTGTVQYLAQAIADHMGKAGLVMMSTFNQSKVAAQDAMTMLRALPPSIQGVARGFLDGSISTKEWTAAMKGLPPLQANLAREFATTAKTAHGFSSLLRSGQPQAQTFAAALSKMTGGATGLNVALMLTGSHAATFDANVKAIANSSKHAGENVAGWNIIQNEANFQIGSAEKAIKAMGIALGMALLPTLTAILRPLTDFLGLVAGNKEASIALAVVVGGVLAGALGSKLAGAFSSAKDGIEGFAHGIEFLLGKLGLMTVATEAQTVAEGEAEVAQTGLNLAMLANPIVLIVAAIALLVVAFVELWKHCAAFRDFWKDAWKDIKRVAEDAFHVLEDAVKVYVKIWMTQWDIVKMIVTEVFRIIMDLVRAYVDFWRVQWDIVKTVAVDVWHGIEAVVSGAVAAVRAVLSWFGRLGGLFRGWWDEAVSAVESVVGRLLAFVQSIPGKILAGLASLGQMMWNAGSHAIESLISGIASGIGSLGSLMGNIASKIAGFIGLSPAREGELSGGGAPEIRGRHIPEDIAKGIMSGLPRVTTAARLLAQAAGFTGIAHPGAAALPAGAPGWPAGAPGGMAELRLEVTGGGASAFEQFMVTAIRQWARVYGGGGADSVQRAFGRVS